MGPLVTVIIPTFNRAGFMAGAIESVLKQTYPNIEIIVVDDGSTDGTKEALRPYQAEIKYLYKDNGGVCSARNVGIKNARGEFIGLMDSDDRYRPGKVELCVRYLQARPDHGMVHTAANFVDGQGNVKSVYRHRLSRFTGDISRRLILMNYICNSTPLVKAVCFAKAGGFDESIYAPADWDMWLRIAEQFKVGFIDEPLIDYDVSSSSVFNKFEKSEEEELYVLNRYFLRNPGRSGFLKRRAFSNFYLRYAQGYLLKGDDAKFHDRFGKCLRSDPLNIKAHAMRLYGAVNQRGLIEALKKKILR